jgi:hypothetical protein
MKSRVTDWENELRLLQSQLSAIDFSETFESFTSAGLRPYLLARLEQLKIKIYQEAGHKTPHLHVDVGHSHHNASFAIDPAVLLAGSLGKKQDRAIIAWIEKHRSPVLEIWAALQRGAQWTVSVEEIASDPPELC